MLNEPKFQESLILVVEDWMDFSLLCLVSACYNGNSNCLVKKSETDAKEQ